jgi:hypothetical protein
VSPRTGLDDVEKRETLTLKVLNSDTSTIQHVAGRYTDCAIPALIMYYIII